MTLLMAVKADDGFVAISDRKETYANKPPKNVRKYHMDKKGGFYVSLAGDGRLAQGVLDKLSKARTGPADVIERIRMIASALSTKRKQRPASVDGILIIAEHRIVRMYDINIVGRRVGVLENRGVVSIRGDGGARILCKYVAGKVDFSGTACETTARMLHVLASDVAEHVESVGGRRYGFDLGMIVAGGQGDILERCAERFGRIDIRLHLEDPTQVPLRGGGPQ